MIRVSFRYDENDIPTGFMCVGHAGFAKMGKDIVCAAVSALTLNFVNSVEALTEDRFTLDTNEKKGYMRFTFEESPSQASKILLRSLELGLKCIIEDNNSKCITLTEWEV